MEESKKIVCDTIYKYITEVLPQVVDDDDIFVESSIRNLGEFYYNKIISSVPQSTEQLINIVIKAISREETEFNDKEDYYYELCKRIGIKHLPIDVLADVEKAYDEIFVQKYNLVIQKYSNSINDINNKLFQIKMKIDEVKKRKPSYSFMRDLSIDESQLNSLSAKCNSLSTRKEMLEFAVKYMNSQFSDFCDINDPVSVKKAIKHTTICLCMSDECDIKNHFSIYDEYLQIVEDDIDRPYALVFKIKIYIIGELARKNFRYTTYTKSEDDAIKEIQDYLSRLPKIDDLNGYKNSDSVLYNEALDKMISDYELIPKAKELIENSVCLRNRKNILIDSIALFEENKFGLFNNILPIQIEGMFANYLMDATTFERFSKMELYNGAVLRDKIYLLQSFKSEIYPEAVEYFMYYFNNLIRNKVAHGRYISSDETILEDKIFSKELFLDMLLLIYMLFRKSETEKMYRFIHGYKSYYTELIKSDEHPCYGALFNDMVGDKLISEYDKIECYRPIQVAYWLVNPYYEKIYEQVDDIEDLLELRNEFLSKDFWEYVLNELDEIINSGYDYKNINMEFLSVVNGLFKCNVSPETKILLGKVNGALQKIKALK